MSYRFAAAALAATAAVTASAAVADSTDHRDFERGAFMQAQAQGLPILVEVNAWWCPVCSSQARTLRAIMATGQYPRLVVFRINYDKQKDEWQRFGAHKQGTLIAFRGARETGRIEFKTDKAQIAALVASTGH